MENGSRFCLQRRLTFEADRYLDGACLKQVATAWNEHSKKNAKLLPLTVSHAERKKQVYIELDNPIIQVSPDA
ncbi:hypothetical protein N7489_005649 [Penicillium chrysogenum]|uniref:Uncharacterized protein n=1 Tax=Penicillium chrysogenum TaxID=5076 RepID=A0ABQ8WRG4_PENCH|nr:uncharacterized protein N7489_005649 [Penicillium chrysogenum]KAJ5245553.1 hypothetical protein N7489_005649 [Penicillium chrysogenum]KAJ5274350.1 hypothetical protein N7505_002895 [Penicillium chrysogenum]KAJ5284868.1 hypothetical protein N7524_000174 [Penicillium chrysogenum]KAJ6156066.1 hypothetical protein N7497_004951 [Penicillium chrysogenum]